MFFDKDYSVLIKELAEKIRECDAVIIGAGSGLSTSAGLTYSGERFEKYFSDFKEKYGITWYTPAELNPEIKYD